MRTSDRLTCPARRQLPVAAASSSTTRSSGDARYGAHAAAVAGTGPGRGDDGRAAPVASFRLVGLLIAGPVGAWLADALVTDPLPVPAANPAPTARP
jgi:hypothetical protein